MFIESNNIDLPKIISQIVKEDVLSDLDKLRKKQEIPLQILKDFFSKSQEVLKKIEADITEDFKKYVCDVDGIDASKWECKILFPEFDYLREAISKLVSFTLYDTNKRSIETKGSGIQRIILLALISYISDNFKEKVIWGIDEPEVFLQPGLQKKVFEELKELSEKINIIVTTHSPQFIDIDEVDNTYLFSAKFEPVGYKRKPNEAFIKVNTYIDEKAGINKIEAIRKHMGIRTNDAWNIVPSNLIVEGEEDRQYLLALAEGFNIDAPNILVCGGADKLAGYLEFLKEFCRELNFIPKVKCLLDHDEKGKSVFESIRKKAQRTNQILIYPEHIIRCDGKSKQSWEYEM